MEVIGFISGRFIGILEFVWNAQVGQNPLVGVTISNGSVNVQGNSHMIRIQFIVDFSWENVVKGTWIRDYKNDSITMLFLRIFNHQ